MSKFIGGIAHEAVGSLATHKPSKSFGDLFEEKKAQLEALQAGLVDQINGIFPRKANKNRYEAAFANPENNKTEILDDNLSKKIH